MHEDLETSGLAVRTRLGYPCSSHCSEHGKEGSTHGMTLTDSQWLLECSGKKVPKASFESAGKTVLIGSRVCHRRRTQWWCQGCDIVVMSAANFQNLHPLIMIPFLRAFLFNAVEDRSACL